MSDFSRFIYKKYDKINLLSIGEIDYYLKGVNSTSYKLIDHKPNFHQMIAIVNEWKQTYHLDPKNHDVIFQNKETLSNIRFKESIIPAISKHSRGFENLPITLESPDEIWSRWEDSDKQQIVLRNYIKIGDKSSNFVVQTRNGEVTDAIFVVNSLLDRYRTGLLILK